MRKPIFSFKEFILEQQSATGTTEPTSPTSDPNRPETVRQAKSRIAKSLVKSIFGDWGDFEGGDSEIEVTKEVKDSLPYKGCGATSPYPLKKLAISLKAFKELLKYLDEKNAGDYKRILTDLENKRSVIIGLRNELSVKKETANQDRFIDGLYFIPQNAKDSDVFLPYQITTVPSLAYYGKPGKAINPDGVGIKLPGDTLYYLKEHTLGGNTYKMLVEGEPISVGRYPEGATKFETYKPDIFPKKNCGMLIHRSSTKGRGICVGPWSGGCQVFADGDEYKEFISKAEQQTINAGKFFYGLMQLDDIPRDIFKTAMSDQPLSIEKQGGSKEEEISNLTKKDISDYAEQIYRAVNRVGTDDDSVYGALQSLETKNDWNQLVAAFGTRDDKDLVAWIKDDMNSDEIEKVNDILSKIGVSI